MNEKHGGDGYGSGSISSLLDKIDELVSVVQTEGDTDSLTLSPPNPQPGQFAYEFGDAQLEEIELGTKRNLPIEIYAKKCYNWMQMREIRLGLAQNLNTDCYANPLYSANQMREIRLGLADHLDVSLYTSLVLSCTDMQRLRKVLFSNAYRENPRRFGRTVWDDAAGIQLRIGNDCMKAYVKIPEKAFAHLTESDLIDLLESYQITYGLIQENINRLLLEKKADTEVCIAQGKPPVKGKSGYYELFFDNNIEKGRTAPPDGEIDYTDVTVVDAISPGDVLVRYHPAQKETELEGMTVTGIPVEGVMGEELPPLSGAGIRYDEEKQIYIATQAGCASYNDTTASLNVWKIYEVHGSVSYYQSLEYDGTVHVHGSVNSMASIRAEGDIIIDGFAENALIYSRQNVVLKGGANGAGQGSIQAGGAVRGKFFENMEIKAGGMVEGNYFFNCSIDTDDRLIARGKKARILGGRVTAAIGVDAVIVGNYLSKKTVFNVGDISSLEKRITDLRKTMNKAVEDLEQLRLGQQKLIVLLGGKAVGNALYDKTCNAIQIIEEQIYDYEQEINRLRTVRKRAEKAYVRVQGRLQSDIVLIINGTKKSMDHMINQSLFITRDNKNRR